MKLIYMLILTISNLSAVTTSEIKEYADQVSDYYSIDSELVRAIIKVESEYCVTAKSYKDAYGLMQVTELAYTDYLKKNPSTPYTNFSHVKYDYKANIAVGVWYLKRSCYKQTGNWCDAITAYFWGVNHTSPTLIYYNKVVSKMCSVPKCIIAKCDFVLKYELI